MVSSVYSRSILKVSSVAGSVRTISGSLSMCSPSRVKGSILSSSRGNWESESKLTSPTPAKELVSSFDKLGGDSPVTRVKRRGDRPQYCCSFTTTHTSLHNLLAKDKVMKQLAHRSEEFTELARIHLKKKNRS